MTGLAACYDRVMDSRRHGAAALRLLHYWWPLAMGYSLTFVARRGLAQPIDAAGLGALLAGILSAYSLDRVIDAPDDRQVPWLNPVLAAAAIVGATACGAFLVQLPIERGAVGIVLGVMSLCYPALKRLPLAKTIFVAAVWTWAVVVLPFAGDSWFGWRQLLQPVALPMFLLVAAGCLLCDLKDVEADRLSQVRSLPAMFGPGTTAVVAALLALASAAMAFGLHRPGMVVAALCLTAMSLFPKALATDATGPLVVDAILTVPGMLVAAHLV